MKKIIYLCCLLCSGAMTSCDWNSDPLELVYPGTDLSGNKNNSGSTLTPEEQAIEDFKNVLAQTDYAWKLSAKTAEGTDINLYLIFDFENNKLKTISDHTLSYITIDLNMAVNDGNKIVLDLTGTDLSALGDQSLQIDDTQTEGQIKCSGLTTGGNYTLVPAGEDEVNNLIPLSVKMQKANLDAGLIVTADGKNVAHYYMDVDKQKMYLTYWNDGYVNFAEGSFTSGTEKISTQITLSALGNIELKGIEKTRSGYKLDGNGFESYKLVANTVNNLDVRDFVVNGDDANGGFHFVLHPNKDWGDYASDVFMDEMKAWTSLTSWEVACGSWSKGQGWAPGFCFSTNSVLPGWSQNYEYIVWGDNYKGTSGRFLFTEKNPGQLAPSGASAYNDVKKHLPKILEFLESKDGLFVAFENKNKTGKGYSYIYLFDPVRHLFLKMAKDGRFGNSTY